MSDVVLVLGAVTFAEFEVPDRIPFGGDQMLKTHRPVGGARVLDAMGRDDIPLEWTGRFLGPDALSRARTLDAMRIAGEPVTLSWSELAFSVVIRRFVADFQRTWDLPYQITCEVVSDLSAPLQPSAGPSIDDVCLGDVQTIGDLSDLIADPTLSTHVAGLQGAFGQIAGVATATRSAINTVLAPITDAAVQVASLIGTVGGGMIDTSLGGVVAGGDPLAMAATLLGQTAFATGIEPLYHAHAVLGRLSVNLNAVAAAGQTITVAGGDLYGLAVGAYGSLDAWADIAKANDLVDPMLSGINTLVIPATTSDSGGVLQP